MLQTHQLKLLGETSWLCSIELIQYITGSQNTTKIYCNILYNMLYNYMFRPFFRPSSGCIYLALKVLYHDDNLDYFDDEISIILTYALFFWRVYRQFIIEGFGPWMWDGSDG